MRLIISILCVFIAACGQTQQNSADIIFIDGVIYTADSAQSVASALAIKGNKIFSYKCNPVNIQNWQDAIFKQKAKN